MSIEKEKICTQLKILSKIKETPDTVSLILEVPRTTGGKFNYRAGQFLTFFMDINGEEIRRSYSLASAPETDSNYKVTIKLVPQGKGSTFLVNHIDAGESLWSTPPGGHFCLPEILTQKQLYFFAAGSGITPIFSLIKSALKQNPKTICHLIYQNRSDENIIFEKDLEVLLQTYTDRLLITSLVSQPTAKWAGLTGRLDEKYLKSYLNRHQHTEDTLFYLCGPNAFMEMVHQTLKSENINQKNIIKEAFTVVEPTVTKQNQDPHLDLDSEVTLIGDISKKAVPQIIEAIIDGETHSVEYKNNEESVLDCLLRNNLNPPYSCLDGACMACIAKVTDGLVYQKDLGILTEDNVEAQECLTCQARPASKKVAVHFETF